jgi:hypothetical protein
MEKEKYELIKKNIQNIEINIYTNIKGEEKKPVSFTRSLLKKIPLNNYISLSDTPFFVTNYQIPYNYIKNLPLDEKINILFNKELFAQTILKNQYERSEVKDNEEISDKINENAENNIKILLKLLFPTYYPVKGNHTDTYSELIEQKLPNVSDFSSYLLPITSVINNMTKKRNKTESIEASVNQETTNFSYLTIAGKDYTILKVVYLNDFINNLKYKEILSNFFIFKKWKEKKNEEIEWEIIKQKNKIIELMNKLSYDLNIPQNKCDINNQLQKQFLTTNDLKNYRSVSENYKVKNDNIEILLKYLNETFFNDQSTIDLNNKTFEEYINKICKNKNIMEINYIISISSELTNNSDLKRKLNNLQKLTNIKNNTDLKTLSQTFDTNYNDIISTINDINNENQANKIDLEPHLVTFKNEFEALIKKLELIKNDEIERKKEDIKINNIYDKQIRNKALNSEEKAGLGNYTKKIDSKYNEYLEFLNVVDSIYTSKEVSIQYTYAFNNTFSIISGLLKKLKLITKIKIIYFDDSTNILQETSDEIQNYFKENYKEYNEFIQIIKKFLIPYRESNNEELVKMISNYVNGNVKDLTEFLTDINNEKIQNHKSKLHVIYDEFHNLDEKKPKYEIQIYVDLMEGKLTKSILKNEGCHFKDNELVNSYYKTLYKNKYENKYEFNQKMPVLKIGDFNVLSTETRIPNKVNQPDGKSSVLKTGGQKKTKRIKFYKQKCKKRRATRKTKCI